MDPVGFASHDHGQCISGALAVVDEECARKGLQFTPVRRRVLEILLHEHRALGAYDVLEHLRQDGFGSQPPVAYRALEFLVKHGFAHRIERLNAFVACVHPGEIHAPTFLICSDCAMVAEAPGRQAELALRKSAAEIGFEVSAVVVEAEGLCPACVGNASA